MERLNKVLAHAGVGSRRRCDDLIAVGRVSIDGIKVTEAGTKVDPAVQKISVDQVLISTERKVYWVLHKPRGVLCTNYDPSGRERAIDLVPHIDQRVYTVGRLDEDSEGLLLLTNDGDLANQLMHPRYGIEKTYLVQVAGSPTPDDLERLIEGVFLAEGKVRAKYAKRVKVQGQSSWLRIVLCEGKNREIRRMLAKQGHKVLRLRRISLGPIQLDRPAQGQISQTLAARNRAAAGLRRSGRQEHLSAGPLQLTARVLLNERLARDTYRIRLDAPELAERIRPGQFVMLRLVGGDDPLLGRPFALYDTILDAAGRHVAIDIVYLVVGKVTSKLTSLSVGDRLGVWGPLGNGFPPFEPVTHVACVAGGIGQTPFLAYTRELLGTRGYGGNAPRRTAARVSLYYGVRSTALAAGVDEFRDAGADVQLASNDGSIGHHGFVTDLLRQHPKPDRLSGCGPEPMLHALARVAADWGVPCDVSLETPMACGLGICFSCVAPIKTADGWDYKRVCVDGPVFDAASVLYSEPRP